MKTQRRHDLDWIRVLVFGLLIFYHVGMFFVPWGWHIKNNSISEAFILPMWFVNQWRLPILFLISGMGTRFALSSRSLKEYLTERHNRLIIPLVFGMIVIVAPQVYVERMAEGAAYSSFLDFYPHYFEGVYPAGNFSWHHLWFLPYLFVYSVILSPFFIHIRGNFKNPLLSYVRKLLSRRNGFIMLAIPLAAAGLLLEPHFPVTHNLVHDWYAFTYYLIIFLYGFLFISAGRPFWVAMNRDKFPALVTGVFCFLMMIWLTSLPESNTFAGILYPFIKSINVLAWMAAILGYGAVFLNRPGPVLSYCNQAVYPFYIIHQTLTVVAAWYIYDNHWPVSLKFLFLLMITFGGSWLFYEIVKRFPLTRFLFGMKQEQTKIRFELQEKPLRG